MVKLTPSVIYSRTKMSVECVKKLNLWGCEIDDISLCSQMRNLQVLSLSVNNIKHLEPLRFCEKLEELYLRKNEIEDLSELAHLVGLKCLRVLWIDENPCTQNIDYRRQVLSILPNLSKLDNKMVTPEERRRESNVGTNLMSHSMYAYLPNSSTMVDTVMPFSTTSPLQVSYSPGSTFSWENNLQNLQSDEEESLDFVHMNASGVESGPDDMNEDTQTWVDFSMDDNPQTPVDPVTNPQMVQSVYEESQNSRQSRSYHLPSLPAHGLSFIVRNNRSMRSQSMSPARQQRVDNLLNAICALMDELIDDQDGLRTVITQAQKRIKKQH